MAQVGVPWRSAVALACIIGVMIGGHVSVDRYSDFRSFIVPTVLAVIGLEFAWNAVRCKLPHERLLGVSSFVVLSHLCLYMLYDRLSGWLGWRAI